MKLREIFFRELKENGQMGEREYPFTSDEKSEWSDIEELAKELFEEPGTEVCTENNWVTIYFLDEDDEKSESEKRVFRFDQF